MTRQVALLAAAILAAPASVVLTAGPSSSHPYDDPGSSRPSTEVSASAASALPACPPTQLTRTGSQTHRRRRSGHGRDVGPQGRRVGPRAPAPIGYPIRSDAWTRGCIVGAQVNGNVPEEATRDQWYDGKDGGPRLGGEVFRVTLTNTPGNYVLIRDTVAQDFEDAYDPNGLSPAHAMYLDHVQARYIRDDCIENEGAGRPGADHRRRATQPVRRLFQRLRGASPGAGTTGRTAPEPRR